MNAALDRRILEELVYEHVRVTVDLHELEQFEADVRASLSRALRDSAASPRERPRLLDRCLRLAWARVQRELHASPTP